MGLGHLFVLFFPYQKEFLPSPPIGVKLMCAEAGMGEEPVGWVLWGMLTGVPNPGLVPTGGCRVWGGRTVNGPFQKSWVLQEGAGGGSLLRK